MFPPLADLFDRLQLVRSPSEKMTQTRNSPYGLPLRFYRETDVYIILRPPPWTSPAPKVGTTLRPLPGENSELRQSKGSPLFFYFCVNVSRALVTCVGVEDGHERRSHASHGDGRPFSDGEKLGTRVAVFFPVYELDLALLRH